MLFAAWIITMAASLGAVFIGEVMGQAPCELCWFQRAFIFPLAIILGIAAFRSDRGVLPYALPLACAGWAIALFHSFPYLGVITEDIQPCGSGPSCTGDAMMLYDSVPIPFLSLFAFTATLYFLILYFRRSQS
jgi:disulfide bond formation protein DsbB